MKIDVCKPVTTISGVPFMLPPAVQGGEPIPLVLGNLLIESALAPDAQQGAQAAPQTAAQIVYRDMLARRLFTAIDAKEEATLTTDDVAFLKQRLPGLEAQRGFHVSAIAAALMLLCPDDFK